MEETGEGCLGEGFGVVPASLMNEGGMEGRHDGVLELDLRTGEDELISIMGVEASRDDILRFGKLPSRVFRCRLMLSTTSG